MVKTFFLWLQKGKVKNEVKLKYVTVFERAECVSEQGTWDSRRKMREIGLLYEQSNLRL